jgi:phage tail sheath protein FI
MAQRTIQSPGVEINEVDLSLRAVNKIGTNIFVTGFAPQGPSDEIVQVSSLSEFETIYGTPTNAAERYFYHTVAQSFNSRANILVNRLPYGESLGDGFTNKYWATVYPAVPVNQEAKNAGLYSGLSANIAEPPFGDSASKTVQFSPASAGNMIYYYVGQPTFLSLTQAQYQSILDDSAIDWSDTPNWVDSTAFTVDNTATGSAAQLVSLKGAAIITLNTAKTTVNNSFEGYYTALLDNTNLYATTNYNDVELIKVSKDEELTTQTYGSLTNVPADRLNFALSATFNTETIEQNISEVAEKITTFNVATSTFDDTLVSGLFRLRSSVFSPEVTKLDFFLDEGYFGSIDYYRQINSENGGQPISYYLPQKFSNSSVNTAMKINPYISGKYSGTTLSDDGEPNRKIRIVTDGLINRTYDSGEDGDTGNLNQYKAIVGLTSDEVQFISDATDLINGITVTAGTISTDEASGVNDYYSGFGTQSMIPAASYKTNTRGAAESSTTVTVGNIPGKLDRVFDRLANIDIFDIDIIPEAGLATINTTVNNTTVAANKTTKFFDDRDNLTGLHELSATGPNLGAEALSVRSDWNTVESKFITFAQNTRKDFIYISDPIRQIFVLGENTKQINISGQTFPLNILNPIKQTYSIINTNYAAAYATWAQVYDNTVSGQVWIPMSGVVAAKYAQTDANFAPWYAPAGFTRGLLDTVNDVAIYPNQKQRDSLYDQANINPVAFFPSEGFVLYGQKTLQSKPSAFDRVNVRRLFLYLEKRVREVVKYFVFEPNTLFTRTNVLNVINPILEDAKNNEGVYDYLVICDERNNTPEVIDANELVVDIYLKPVRAAEFILVNFYATRTGQDFSEIVG